MQDNKKIKAEELAEGAQHLAEAMAAVGTTAEEAADNIAAALKALQEAERENPPRGVFPTRPAPYFPADRPRPGPSYPRSARTSSSMTERKVFKMLRYQKGYIFEGHTFVTEKSDIHNAREEQFVEATALLPDCWINAEERLPEIPRSRIYGGTGCVGCLVVAEADVPTVLYMEYERATIRGKATFRWKWRDRISTWKVTHWQYLPEPPTVGR